MQEVRAISLDLDAPATEAAMANAEAAARGGALRGTVEEYLRARGYDAHEGKDRSGHSGAFLWGASTEWTATRKFVEIRPKAN